MNKKIFNKLVRDKIPEVIKGTGEKPFCKTLTKTETLSELNKKLTEEVKEYLDSYQIEELADIVEVIYGILYAKNITIEQFEEVRKAKAQVRGGFEKGVFLEYTLSDKKI